VYCNVHTLPILEFVHSTAAAACCLTFVKWCALIMSLMFLLKTLAKISYSSQDSGSRILQVNTKGPPAAAAAAAAAASLSPAAAHTGHGL
jgi:hypothetical protein